MNSVKDTLGTAQKQVTNFAEHGYTAAQDGVHDAVERVSRLVTIARNLGLDDVLGVVGLQRRQGPGGAIASFGAGVAVGAGLGLLFAPMPGSDLRGKIGKALGLTGVVDKLAEVEGQVEDKLVEKKDELKANMSRATEKAKERVVELKDKAAEELKGNHRVS